MASHRIGLHLERLCWFLPIFMCMFSAKDRIIERQAQNVMMRTRQSEIYASRSFLHVHERTLGSCAARPLQTVCRVPEVHVCDGVQQVGNREFHLLRAARLDPLEPVVDRECMCF